MNQLDTYYRALTEYSKEANSNREIASLTEHLIGSEPIKEKLYVKRAVCIIDEEWVNEIEKGLIYVEKAIKEERQFILSNGEVIPIEKVKGISRQSVEHLSRHSNLITRYNEGETIVPDGLYTVEKLTDYTVYENKFLYMLLCYLRDFISIRYNAILDITNKYDGDLDIEKEISMPRRNLKYKISLKDVKKDDEYLRNNNPAQATIDKINLLLKSVIAYLATPLMQEVSKVAMIKPPIVKTNVLKMNNNFKNAVALYEYIVAYDKLGYRIEYKENNINTFHGNLANDMASVIALISFITYEYGLAIEDELKENYLSENDKRRIEELEQRESQIKALKRRLDNGQITPYEYVLLVEKQIRSLEGEKAKISSLNAKILELKDLVKKLKLESEQQKVRIYSLEAEIGDIIDRHKQRIEILNKRYREESESLRNNYENTIYDLKKECEDKINELISNYETKLALMKVECENTIDTLTAEYENRLYKANGDKRSEKDKNENLEENESLTETAKRDYFKAVLETDKKQDSEIKAFKDQLKLSDDKAKIQNQELSDKVNELSDLVIKTANINDELSEKLSLAKAQVLSVKLAYGLTADENYGDKKSFESLEKQYKAFKKYYNEKRNLVKQNSKKDGNNSQSKIKEIEDINLTTKE